MSLAAALFRHSCGGLCFLTRQLQDGVCLVFERRQIDLHAIEHGAPVARYRSHRDRFANLLVGGAIGLGNRRVEIHAVLAWDLRGDREADQLLGFDVEAGFGAELD